MIKRWVARIYQLVTVCFMLKNKNAGLFLDPGLGKTSCCLSAIRILKTLRKTKGVLIIAPLRVCEMVWPEEIKKWSNFSSLDEVILHGRKKDSLLWQDHDIYIMNPEGLPWLYEELLRGLQEGKKCPFDMLVLDESTLFKNPTAECRFVLLRDMLCLFKRRYILTGTPAPKGYLDLWAQVFILDRGASLGDDFARFRRKYFTKSEYSMYKWDMKEGADKAIQKRISHLILEMPASEYLKLPPFIYNTIPVPLRGKAESLYSAMEKELFIEVDGGTATAQEIADRMNKCAQICNGRVYEDIDTMGLDETEIRIAKKNRKVLHIHDYKLKALQELSAELAGKPLLIAVHYKHDIDALRSVLGKELYVLRGSDSKKSKQISDMWNNREIQFLAGNPTSMGHGLNLQFGGNDICWYSLTFNLELYLQFNKRLNRPGNNEPVRIHHLACPGTVDMMMLERLSGRDKQQKALRKALREYRLSKGLLALQ